MVLNLVQSALLYSMENCINQVLSLDAGACNKLENISGKSLRVQIEKPLLEFTLLIGDGAIHLHQDASSDESRDVDTTISGKASSIFKLLIKKTTHSLHADGIVITGNTSLLESMQNIFQELDIDWEYELSKIIGDIPAQAVSDSLTSARQFTNKTKQRVIQDVDTYLHDESKAFPSIEEVTGFYHSIDQLRLRVDRLQSRVDKLQVIPPTQTR
ncbi:MAG: SCP2 sterol-binding domain-containing protein [Gammaproteobacteria bacterium]|nr:SCP2 sterol-binding domain-containing protein [Gammaproteobacteria bacterium]